MGVFQTLIARRAIVIAALPIHLLTYTSRKRLLEIEDDLECEVTDGDAWSAAHVLAHDVSRIWADS